jgi:hypothetical protein
MPIVVGEDENAGDRSGALVTRVMLWLEISVGSASASSGLAAPNSKPAPARPWIRRTVTEVQTQ